MRKSQEAKENQMREMQNSAWGKMGELREGQSNEGGVSGFSSGAVLLLGSTVLPMTLKQQKWIC